MGEPVKTVRVRVKLRGVWVRVRVGLRDGVRVGVRVGLELGLGLVTYNTMEEMGKTVRREVGTNHDPNTP